MTQADTASLAAELQRQIKRAEQAEQLARSIQADEQRWKLALEVNDVGVWDFDALARSVVGSKRWKDVWEIPESDGAPRRSGIPLPIHRIHPDELPQFLHDWYELLSNKRAGLEVGVKVMVGADYHYMRLRGRVVQRDGSGTALRVVGTLADIHDARRHQLKAANIDRLQSVGELAAGIAHEIHTPTECLSDNVRFLKDVFGSVQAMVAELQALLESPAQTVATQRLRQCLADAELPYLSTQIPKATQICLDSVQQIAKMVSAIREFSHPNQEQVLTDLNQTITNAVTITSNEWKNVARLDTDLDSSLPRVPVVPGEFSQVIVNMIINAVQAIADRRAAECSESQGTIRIASARLPQWAEITITDDGSGIAESIQERIFDPFFTTRPAGKGSGQGLAIAHNVIVRHHGGSISVDSGIGRGATFTLRVPLEGLSVSAARQPSAARR